MSEVFIQDLTVRDGNQSLLATRMQREDIITLAEALDKVGFHSLEVWGGATFDSAFRFLHQSAWENLREIRQAAKNTKLSMLLRGQNIVGYRHYDNDTLDRFIRLTLENGIDVIRCFDALNDTNNLKNAFKFVKKHNGHLQGAIAYTVSPVHNNEYYVKLAKEFVDMGADSICIKDMAGICTPQNAYELVSALKEAVDVPIDLHTHTTGNATALVMLEAMKAGVDIVDGCISPFSGGTSHLADETLLEVAKLAGREVNIDREALSEAYEIADRLASKYIASGDMRARSLVPNPKILTYQVPGGMLSNLLSQLEGQKKGDRFNDVLKEVPNVRKDMGYPPLVTPLSQMVGTQAVMNVLFGEPYKMVPKEIKDYVQGFYGRSPAEKNPEVVAKILKGVEPKTPTDPDDLPYIYEDEKKKLEKALGREASEEEVIAYILFPQQVESFLTGAWKEEEAAAKAKAEAEEQAKQEKVAAAAAATQAATSPSVGSETLEKVAVMAVAAHLASGGGAECFEMFLPEGK